MFFPGKIVFSDFMMTWKKNIFSYKNVILSENYETHRLVGLKILLPRYKSVGENALKGRSHKHLSKLK